MPNMEELLNQISVEITRDRTTQLFKSGQLKLSEGTSRQCVFALTGGKFSGYYRFKKGFTVLPTYHRYSKKKLTEQSDTAHQPG